MKRLIFFLLIIPGLISRAQVSQNFEPVNGNANVRSIMQGQCWRILGWNNSIGIVAPINGTQSFVSGNGASAASLSGIATPYLLMTGNDSLAFSFQWYGGNIPQSRWFRILTIDLNGNQTLHDSVLIDNSNNNTLFYQHVFQGVSGIRRVYINYRGNAGTGRFGIDDLFVSANFLYPNGCFNRDIDNRNDIQDRDDDNDGIEDFVEVCGPGSVNYNCAGGLDPNRDSDNDGVTNFHDANYCVLNAKGVCNAMDIDGDGVINSMDLDGDGDGILDAQEANGGILPAAYQNGIIGGFTGNNGMPDIAETAPNSGVTTLPLVDSDGDGIPDFRETDSDNDGIPDNIEAQTTAGFIPPTGLDSDFDGVDNAYDGISGPGANGLSPVNSEAAGLPDYLDTDSDNDGISDAQEAHDLNANGTLDPGELPFTFSGIDGDADGLDNVWDPVSGFSINSGYLPTSFPNAGFGSAERDWREANIFASEVCNNGIDDDGDGFIDCQDADCVVPSVTSVSFNPASCGNTSDGSIQILATNASNFSINNGTSFSVQSNFNGVAPGTYHIIVSSSGGCTASFAGNPVVILAGNCAPIGFDDTFVIDEDQILNGSSVLANDDATDGPSLDINSLPFSGPQHGGVTINPDGTFIYTSNPNFNGIDTFSVVICDGGLPALCDTTLVIITINPVNDFPSINNESVVTNENTAVSGNFLLNDTDAEGPLSSGTSPLSGPSNGSILLSSVGAFTYTPNTGFQGIDTVVVQVCDNDGICGNDTLFITVNGVNTPPVINNESVVTNENTAVSGNILLNDTDAEGPLSSGTSPLSGPSNGSILLSSVGAYTYTPNTGFQGIDTVVVQVCDNDGVCGNDTLFITVNGVNIPPVIFNETFTTPEETLVNGNILSNDSDDSGVLLLNILPVLGPLNGVIFMNASGNFSYTPDLNFNGTDTIVFVVCDNDGLCANDTLFITVTPVNDQGLVLNDVFTTTEEQSVSGNILSNDSDADGSLSVQLPVIQTTLNGVLVVQVNGDFTYTPSLNFNGTDTAIVFVCDPLGNCLPDTLFITVSPVDDPATVNNEQASVSEDGVLNINVLLNDTDPDGNLTANTVFVTGPAFGNAVVSISGDLVYTPNPDFNGSDTVVISVCDVLLNCINDTVFITVNPVNDLPQINNETYNINQGATLSDNLLQNDNDIEGPLTAGVVPFSGPLNGAIIIQSAGDFIYTPAAGFTGTDTIVVNVCDVDGACGLDTIFVQVTPFNQSPIVNNDTISVNEDGNTSGNILTNDSDPDGTLSATVQPLSGPNHGLFSLTTTGDFTYQPNTNFFGTDTIIMNVCDNGGICVNDTLVVTVHPLNDIPVVLNDTVSVDEDLPFSGNLLQNDNDTADGSILTASTSVLSGPFHGIILVNSNGSYTYVPNPSYTGSDTVIVEVCDSGIPLPVICVHDTLFIEVTAVNDPPVTVFQTVNLVEDNNISGSMLNGDSDPEGTVLVYSVTPVQSPDFGIATVDSAGNFTYVPLANFNGADTLVVQVCDSGTPLPAQCTLDTLVILVSAVNDAPYTQGDTASVMGGFIVSGDMMQNNTDIVEGTTLTASTIPVYGPSNGTIIINLDGTYTYTADSTFSGTDTVIVQICDSGLPLPPACASDTLVITVNAAPFAANAGPDVDICDSSYTMQANIPNLGTGQWASVSGFGIPVNPADPGTIINGLALGQNIFVWTITYNSIVTHDTVVITVIQPPSPAFAGFDQEVCGNTTVLQATAPIIGSGNWTILSGSGIIVLPGNPGSPVNSLGLGENRLIWQVTNSVCPSNADTVLIRTYTNPSLANAGSDIQVCADATSFNAVDPAVGQGWWQVLSGYGTIDSTTNANPSVSDLVPGESVFLWRVINGPCAASFDTLRVMRFEPPDAAFAGSDTSICATELLLTARIPSIGTGAWTGPGVFSPDIVSPLAKVSSLPIGLNTITWVVSNGVCPESRDDIQVEVVLCDTGLFIPEGFSPNGDGVNDQFVISGAKGRRITLRIFNRWGSLVFESNDYQNNWDGNGGAGFSLGKELTEGTYYYVAEIEGLEARKGYLTLWK